MPRWLLALGGLALSIVLQGCDDKSKDGVCQLSRGGAIIKKVKKSTGPSPSQRKRDGCPMIYVPIQKKKSKSEMQYESVNEVCPGIQMEKANDDDDFQNEPKMKSMEIRAVKYSPRAVGKVGEIDLYSDSFSAIHQRDLAMISKILKANTIRLDPWVNEKKHAHFLKLCKQNGLFVIPTFDLDYFFRTPQWRDAPYSDLEKKVLQHFHEFLNNVQYDEPILMWSINHAPYLNETITNGFQSSTTGKLNVYMQLIKALRAAHYHQEWNKSESRKDTYLRPLALPLRLDTQKNPADVGWYMAFMESNLGAWPDHSMHRDRLDGLKDEPGDDQHRKEEKEKSFEALKEASSFDVWIAETMPQTRDLGVRETVESVILFNDSRPEEDEDAQVYPNCGDEDCAPPPTTKAAILQYGFASLVSNFGKSSKRIVDVDLQQEYLKDVWQAVITKYYEPFKNQVQSEDEEDNLRLEEAIKYTCVSGAIIDEWVDDWDRCSTMPGMQNRPAEGYSQNKGGVCDEVKPGHLVHVEWFGLNSQYSFMGSHCIEPRYLSEYRGEEHLYVNRTQKFGFRFELDTNRKDDASEQEVWKEIPGRCRLIVPSTLKLGEIIVCASIVIVIWVVCGCVRKSGQKSGEEGLEEDGGGREIPLVQGLRRARSGGSVNNMGASMQNMASIGGADDLDQSLIIDNEQQDRSLRRSGAQDLEELAVSWKAPKAEFKVEAQAYTPPVLRRGINDVEQESPFFTIELTADAMQVAGIRINQKQVQAHLDAHLRTQEKRLYHQLETEANAVQAIEKNDDLDRCFKAAMVHIHARVLEGYLAWLEKSDDKDVTLKSLEAAPKGLPPRPWQLWTEALLLRVIESLSEMGIHSPEFLAAFYHDVRWRLTPTGARHPAELSPSTSITFTIPYDVLHFPLEALRKQSNPYRGGVNFDDINDYGYFWKTCRDQERTVRQVKFFEKKTHSESSSLAVVLDIISNFQAFFTVKVWLLLLAWYLYLGEDPRNGYGGENMFNPKFYFSPPKFQRFEFLQMACVYEAFGGLFTEILIFFHGLGQGRRTWIGGFTWMIRRIVLIIITSFGSALLTLTVLTSGSLKTLDYTKREEDIVNEPYNDKEWLALYSCAGYILLRVVTFLMVSRPWHKEKKIPFLPGRPASQMEKCYVQRTKQQGFPEGDPDSLQTNASRRLRSEPSRTSIESNSSPEGGNSEQATNNLKLLSRKFAWVMMLSITFAMEVKLICPLAAGFDWDDFCGSRCGLRKIHNKRATSFFLSFFFGSDCIACTLSMYLALFLVLLTGFFDIYYIFYLGTAIMGYAMGEQRGLRDVLSTTHAHVDLVTSSRDIGIRTSRRNKESLTHGEAMQNVFGAAWRMIWSRVVEALFEDCFITEQDADTMVQAASTVRWPHRARSMDRFATPHDRFKKVKFVSLKARKGKPGEAKRGRCISELRVWIRGCAEAKTFSEKDYPTEFQDPTEVIILRDEEERKQLLKALITEGADRNKLEKDIKIGGKRVQVGTKLVSGKSVRGSDEEEVFHALEDLEIRSTEGRPIVFQDTSIKFEEVCVELEEPSDIQAVSFSTGTELVNYAFDPVRWKVLGLLHDPNGGEKETWKQLVWQDTDFTEMPERRNERVMRKFLTELWRCSGGSSQVLDLSPYSQECKERLAFFTRSLKHMRDSKRYPIRSFERLLECHIGVIPPLSQIIPVYSETVILQHKFLCANDGVNTNLGFMTSQFPQEWEYFSLKHKGLLEEVLDRQVPLEELSEKMYRAYIDYDDRIEDTKTRRKAKALMMEVRMWASMRSQTVSRTVVGAMQYHQVLSSIPCIETARDVSQAMEHCVELVLAHQTYGSKSCSKEDEEDVRYLLQKYRQYPFFLVFDYDAEKAKDTVRDKVRKFMKDYHKYEGRVRYASVRARCRQEQEWVEYKKHAPPIPFYTEYNLKFLPKSKLESHAKLLLEVLGPDRDLGFEAIPETHWDLVTKLAKVQKKHLEPLLVPAKPSKDLETNEDCIEIIEVLPRQYPLRLGSKGFETQGKAGNQLGALRFARGHYLQMMDANMGAFLGEAAKVPFILRRFQPHNTNRCLVQARIIGFREAIFTSSHGEVGKIMASAEWSFGTICQRFLKGLGMRMHYGHPDFLDGFWASNRGSLSKASPSINLSEDIFAGFNVSMRGEQSKHVDFLSWEKGRESSFNAAALFFTKVSKGNVGVMRSRDIKLITENLNILDNFSFYFASIGFYLNNLLIDFSVSVYVFFFVLLTLASKNLEEVGVLDSMLASEWIFSLGIVAMCPRFMELILEYGPLAGIIKFLPSIPSCMAMFTFINKSIASGVSETMMTGEADYIATGRPNANTHYSWRQCYFIFCKSHFYPALRVIYYYVVYRLLAVEHNMSSLPMIVLLASCGLWIVAPIIFCPQPTLGSVRQDLSEFWQFIIANPEIKEDSDLPTEARLNADLKESRSTLYEFWLKEELHSKKSTMMVGFAGILLDVFKFLGVVAVCYSSMLDNIWNMFVLLAVNFLLVELWRLLHHSAFVQVVSLGMWFVVPAVLFQEGYVNVLSTFAVLVLFLQVINRIIRSIYWMILRPDIHWEEHSEKSAEDRQKKNELRRKVRRYDEIVQYTYEVLLGYQLHLYSAMVILLFFLITQAACVALDLLCGIHSWYLLNGRLRGTGCCHRREGFVPRRTHAAIENVWERGARRGGEAFSRVVRSFSSRGNSNDFESTNGTPAHSQPRDRGTLELNEVTRDDPRKPLAMSWR